MPNVTCVSRLLIQSGLLTELRIQMLHTQCYVAPTCRFSRRYKNATVVKMNWLTVSTYPKTIDHFPFTSYILVVFSVSPSKHLTDLTE